MKEISEEIKLTLALLKYQIENASIMKGELSALHSEVNSLSMEESRISEQLLALRDANEMLLAKANNFESENNSLKEAIDLMRIELKIDII